MFSTKSIRFFVALKIAPWITLFLVFALLILFSIEKSIFSEEVNRLHEERVSRFVENKNRVINGFVAQVNAIASNELIINSLIDLEDSQRYIEALINSLSLSGTSINSIKIVDFKGDIIIDNGVELSGLLPGKLATFQKVIDSAISGYEYTESSIIFVAPILWSFSAEGAVIVELPLNKLNDLLMVDFLDGEVVAINGGNTIIFSTNAGIAQSFFDDKAIDKHHLTASQGSFNNWYYKSFLQNDESTVYSFESSKSITERLHLFTLLGVVSLIIALAGSLISIILSSSIISRTFSDLLAALQSRKYENTDFIKHSRQGDPDELVKVYESFYELVTDLMRSESFGNDIQSIINSLNEYLIVFDLEGKIILSNLSFQNFEQVLLGNNNVYEKIIPKPLQEDALSPDKNIKDFECVYTILPDSKANIFEDKQERIIRWTRSLYLTPENTIGGLTFIGVDITESKLIEKDIKNKNKAIQNLSQRFNLALEAAVIGVWEFNVDENVLIWDDRMYEIYQVNKDHFDGSIDEWMQCIHPEDLETTHSMLQNSLKTGEDFFSDFRVVWPNQEVRWVSANARVTNEDGLLRIVGANIDITETKRLNQNYEQALSRAEELVKIKSQFLASMSHEIRTPMNGVLGMLNLIKRTELNTQQNRYAELAFSSANSLLSLINDILDFSKVDAGKMELECIDFDLPHLLGEISESLAQRAQDKGIEVILDIAGINIDMVNGDPIRLRQIFTNLLGNAIKFTEQGEIIVQAAIKPISNNELLLTATVNDTGIGIPKEKIGTLFDSFSQVDASTTRKYGGTGLGLAIVKQLCHLMKGDITITSEFGKGSEFSFTAMLETAKKADEYKDNRRVFDSRNINLSHQFIMLIDDNESNLSVINKQLLCWNAQVIYSQTIGEALRLLDAPKLPDMIFVSANMPEMSGLEFVKRLRSQRRFNQVKVILMTNISTSINADNINMLAPINIFPKPTTRQDLLTNILSTTDVMHNAQVLIQNNSHMSNLGDAVMPISSSEKKDIRILLVEDNVINQEVAQGILASLDLNADVAENGIEALSMLSNNHYDVVLMDCQMPEMDGYETTREIRSGKTLQSTIPIIAMTANAMKGDREKCLSVGMDDYLSKPIDPDQLVEKVKQWSASKTNEQELISMSANGKDQEGAVIWDRNDFMGRIMGNETLALKLVDLFKSDTPKTIDDLATAVDSGEVTQAGLLAHKLKGTVSNLGGIDLAGLMYKIEQAGKHDDLDSIKALWPMVRPKFDQLVEHIERGL